jgi:hypothetical protein
MTDHEILPQESHLERLKLAWGEALANRPHITLATVGVFPDGTIRPRVSDSWSAYVFQNGVNTIGTNYLGFLCDGRRRKMDSIKHPPEINQDVAYVAGNLAVTQTADPVWEVLYQGVARIVPPDDPLYEAITDNWLTTGRFTPDRLREYLDADGAAVGAHAIAAVRLTQLEVMDGRNSEIPRYTRWGGDECPGQPFGLHSNLYEHLHLELPQEDIFTYAP